MFIGKVYCELELDRRHPAFEGLRFFLIHAEHEVDWGGPIVAVDTVGADVGDTVVVALAPLGSALELPEDLPVEAAVIGTVESITYCADDEDEEDGEEGAERRPARGHGADDDDRGRRPRRRRDHDDEPRHGQGRGPRARGEEVAPPARPAPVQKDDEEERTPRRPHVKEAREPKTVVEDEPRSAPRERSGRGRDDERASRPPRRGSNDDEGAARPPRRGSSDDEAPAEERSAPRGGGRRDTEDRDRGPGRPRDDREAPRAKPKDVAEPSDGLSIVWDSSDDGAGATKRPTRRRR